MAAAKAQKTGLFHLNDLNAPLLGVLREAVEAPERLIADYEALWRWRRPSRRTTTRAASPNGSCRRCAPPPSGRSCPSPWATTTNSRSAPTKCRWTPRGGFRAGTTGRSVWRFRGSS
uniref:hypothetical protein n=1 Tax=Sutterella parvirubra TaxID=437898 RepID=UPI0037095905